MLLIDFRRKKIKEKSHHPQKNLLFLQNSSLQMLQESFDTFDGRWKHMIFLTALEIEKIKGNTN